MRMLILNIDIVDDANVSKPDHQSIPTAININEFIIISYQDDDFRR